MKNLIKYKNYYLYEIKTDDGNVTRIALSYRPEGLAEVIEQFYSLGHYNVSVNEIKLVTAFLKVVQDV